MSTILTALSAFFRHVEPFAISLISISKEARKQTIDGLMKQLSFFFLAKNPPFRASDTSQHRNSFFWKFQRYMKNPFDGNGKNQEIINLVGSNRINFQRDAGIFTDDALKMFDVSGIEKKWRTQAPSYIYTILLVRTRCRSAILTTAPHEAPSGDPSAKCEGYRRIDTLSNFTKQTYSYKKLNN